jgi:hypothetical protein
LDTAFEIKLDKGGSEFDANEFSWSISGRSPAPAVISENITIFDVVGSII